MSSRLTFPPLRVVLFIGFSLAAGLAAALNREALLVLLAAPETEGRALVVFTLVAGAWFFASQLVLAPFGTVSVIATSAVIGWQAGLLYFAAMVLAGMIVYVISWQTPGRASRTLAQFIRDRRRQAFLRLLSRRARRRPVLMTAVLRLVPVLPSAGCAMVTGLSGFSLRALLLGTLATGWVRPVLFAVFGDQIATAAREGFAWTSLLANPALWISLAGLGATSAALWLLLAPAGPGISGPRQDRN
ncbi:VTT domain-containing protein [Marinicauda pacifica]|uniref:VTT domain-containing protein n=1 Tax=Marinicauda pacifica TaxID=1133559 RepID=UPI0013053D53|nr:VTT domain-containing protein [Marinicauda pacifica]